MFGEDENSLCAWVDLTREAVSFLNCLIKAKMEIDNTITHLRVIDFISNDERFQNVHNYAMQLEMYHNQIYADLEYTLSALEDLDFTA
ncbi:hypothetical protein APPUASWS_007170 [Arthrospira platensis str. Paraca]|nr:hypothetical protein APPUASWS_029780 [Arthrospira platensis str. Paraca]KDR54361.1 hypothetical protein APPUASWS_030380 [Arthrospira platensis str. Paraca]KDR58103.1 hypothetical protein APPUASWS_007170 [Arthrospira platensis str. Paraca]